MLFLLLNFPQSHSNRKIKKPLICKKSMEFCPKCGGMIIFEKDKAFCAACGTKIQKKPKIEASEKINNTETIAVIKEKGDIPLPIVDIECPKCQNKKAYFWTMQTRASDEAETKFYKCTKCGHIWRKYR